MQIRLDAVPPPLKKEVSSYVISSSEYNYALATWAMELSYTAYNYPEGDPLFFIPGAFMGDVDKPATTFLTEHGFENVRDYNYDHNESVAHVVAHKSIEVSTLETMQENIEGDNIDGLSYNDTRTYASNSNIVRLSDYVYNSSNIVTDNDTDSSDQGLFSSVTLTALSSEESVSSDTRPLIVVDIRGSVTIHGSVTFADWVIDLANQVNSPDINFETVFQEAVDSLYGVEHCEEHSSKNLNCEKYICYLASKGLTNPIVLINGHSWGEAIANIVAAELSETMCLTPQHTIMMVDI